MSEYCKNCFNLTEKLDEKTQELAQLKEDIKEGILCIQCQKALENCKLRAVNEELKKQLQNPEVIVALTDVRTEERELWYQKGLKSDRYKQALKEIECICEPINCKNPADCYMNKPDWNEEVYGCEPDEWKNHKN